MANLSQSIDLGVSATRPYGYIPATGFKTTIPVRENTASILRKEKLEHRSGHLGTLRTNHPVSITRSTFSPVVNKPSNEQIFQERLSLIGHWFDLWSVSQRKRFLKEMFDHCGKPELDFVQIFSDSTLAVKRQDFTKVLPAFLSKYIFSYLDPKSLSRASQVSHHWRNLSEHDEIWMPKCIKHGWYLQYQPSKLENGCWKRHYITSIESLADGRERFPESDAVVANLLTERSDLFTSAETLSLMETPRTQRSRSKSPMTARSNRTVSLEDRPKWQDPDKKPNDLSWDNFKSMSSEGHPNNPKSPSSAYMHSKRWGVSSFLTENTYGLGSMDRINTHPLQPKEFAQYHPEGNKKGTLTEALQAQRVSEGSELLKETPWYFPEKKTYENRFIDLPKKYAAGDKDKTGSSIYPNHAHPRVIFISSRLPAKEVLQDCVMFGVISVVYEYEGTTIDTLMTLLSNVLKNRQAHSIAFLTDGGIGELWLTKDSPVTLETIKRPEMQDFWLKIAMHLIPPGSGSHIDIFTPLASSDDGQELLFQLNVLTGLKCTSPINMIGGYRSFMGDWLEKPEKMKPVNHYFREEKLITWIATAHRIGEALYETEKFLGRYFSTQRRILVSEVVGKVVFDALLLENLKPTLCDVIPVIIDGLLDFGKEMEKQSPLQFLSQYLSKRDSSSSSELSEMQKYQKQKNGEAICDLLCLTKYEKDRAYKLLSTNNIEHQPDRRTAAAVELLSSELEYMRSLSILVDVFMNPLQRTLDASKVIIGIGNIHALFSDICSILEVSKALLKDLTHKIDNWTSESTLADSVIKFCGKSKAYTNYVNNYPIVMRTYDMLIETNPAFRAFIADNEETARTKMLTFHELYMLPSKRVSEYILILNALHANTPPNHPDKTDLTVALRKLGSLNEFVSNHKNKLIKDKEITQIEDRIINCPSLLEGNRQFLREDYVSLLKNQGSKDPVSYSHVQDLILFLFSDALLICILKTEHPPFERVLKKKIIFSTCLALSKVKVDVIANSASIKNGIQLSTKKAQWIFKFTSFQDRVAFIHTIEAAIRSLVRAD